MASLLLFFPLSQMCFSWAWPCLLWTSPDSAVPACFLPYICNFKEKKKTKRNSHVLLLFLFLIQGKEKMAAADSSLLDRPSFEYGQGDNMKNQISLEGHLRRKQRARLSSESLGSVRGTPRSPSPSQTWRRCDKR